ncbi:MAG: hypothetical protein GC157_03380 [Frankiales bacterium]|nr:hypothetical protein [Frankiales bacterium]
MSTTRSTRLIAAAALALSSAACGTSTGSLPPRPSTASAPAPSSASPSASDSGSSSASASGVTITSTLDGRTTLPKRLPWEATPVVTGSAAVDNVSFYIDGRLGWVEHNAPYDYSNDGGNLVTTFLPAGRHTFRAVVTLSDGTSADDVVTATVSAPPAVPDAWKGITWARTVSGGDPSADGVWTITAETFGWHIGDPQGGGANQDLDWTGPGRVKLWADINEPVVGQYQYGGAFCDEPDPVHTYTYRISGDGNALTLAPLSPDPCGGRAFILTGTWHRT